MKSTTKSIIILCAVAVSGFFVGMVVYAIFGLDSIIPEGTAIAGIVGKTISGFAMKVSLAATLGTLFFVPVVRHEFLDAFTAGSDFRKTNSKGSRF